ncbi:MAG: glycerol-3-phosphate 1-O-acyltransferase PlsY [Proteobacteria bacterium]|nr:glycerol-3-phosphate 1-O-acyltransferase PlsY [Pseudomonadota bacterium]
MADFVTLGWMQAGLALAFGYLCGSIPFGLILTRLAGTEDIRQIGSKSIGATNVLRTGRKDLAAATVLLDALKGTVAVLIAARWGQGAAVLAGLGAFLGHLYPVWLKFEGGKGVATFLGVLLALWWPGLVLFGVIWLGMAYLLRYSSLSALVASLLTAVARVALDLGGAVQSGLGGVIVVMVALLWWKHKGNIQRLLAGTESRIGEKG